MASVRRTRWYPPAIMVMKMALRAPHTPTDLGTNMALVPTIARINMACHSRPP